MKEIIESGRRLSTPVLVNGWWVEVIPSFSYVGDFPTTEALYFRGEEVGTVQGSEKRRFGHGGEVPYFVLARAGDVTMFWYPLGTAEPGVCVIDAARKRAATVADVALLESLVRRAVA